VGDGVALAESLHPVDVACRIGVAFLMTAGVLPT
jgi:hypothetical protein